MKIAVAQLGARRHYAVPRILHEAGMLERLFTDSYLGNKPWLASLLGSLPDALRTPSLNHLLGRMEKTLPSASVTSFDYFGASYRRRLRNARGFSQTQETFAWAGRSFGERVVRAGFGNADAVWGFNGASLELFRPAKRAGLRCVLEQTVAPLPILNRLLNGEMARWPGWQPGLQFLPEHSENSHRARLEWDLADVIICGSPFVMQGIAECGGPVEKCRVVPYGVDLRRFPQQPPRQRPPGDRLRVLFAGEVGLRKGVPWLLEAARQLGPDSVELRLAGGIAIGRDNIGAYREVATFLGSVPRTRMSALFGWADVLVLPSVCEGSAAVTYEAVASGIPVICTPNAGALATEAVTVVPFGNIAALADAIARYSRDRKPVAISPAVRWQYGFDAYAKRMLEVVRCLDPELNIGTAA